MEQFFIAVNFYIVRQIYNIYEEFTKLKKILVITHLLKCNAIKINDAERMLITCHLYSILYPLDLINLFMQDSSATLNYSADRDFLTIILMLDTLRMLYLIY